MNIDLELKRVLHGVYINTDLACRFVLAELHEMARRAAA